MPNITQFTTDNFRILSYLCTIRGKDDKVSITQQEIANKFDLSRATVNKIVGELKSEGYLEQDGPHIGRYVLSKEALKVINTINGLNNNEKRK